MAIREGSPQPIRVMVVCGWRVERVEGGREPERARTYSSQTWGVSVLLLGLALVAR